VRESVQYLGKKEKERERQEDKRKMKRPESTADEILKRTPLAQEDKLACGGVARGEGV
jgi:hypothetical protein